MLIPGSGQFGRMEEKISSKLGRESTSQVIVLHPLKDSEGWFHTSI